MSTLINAVLRSIGREAAMRLKTRLQITFLAIIVMPVLLIGLIYGVTRIAMASTFQNQYGVKEVSMSLISNPVEAFSELTEEEYRELSALAVEDPERLLDKAYLDGIGARLEQKASGLFVFVNEDGFYHTSGLNNEAAEVLSELDKSIELGGNGYYLDGRRLLIKQLHFSAQGAERGKIYIVTRVRNFVSSGLLIFLMVLIVLVLIVTSFFLTRWIRDGAFTPLSEFNVAMQRIADGDFDYVLSTGVKGEISDLYENYNQMRLRLKESAEEQVQADKQNRELISNISHDLKTPITSIKGYVEGIMDGVADTPEKMDRYIKTIYNKANDMNRLINELTIYSGIDSNRIPYHFHKLNVADYFNDCVEEVGLDLEGQSIRLNYSNMTSPDTLVIADPEQMKRVINNIVSNSVKYMNRENGTIDIRILDELDSIRVEIEDNGKGVSAKEIGRIFERFYRTDASRNSSQGGSGIGLSIVKKIIEDHGGYIWATSKEGEGTCMHFVLRKFVESPDAVQAE